MPEFFRPSQYFKSPAFLSNRSNKSRSSHLAAEKSPRNLIWIVLTASCFFNREILHLLSSTFQHFLFAEKKSGLCEGLSGFSRAQAIPKRPNLSAILSRHLSLTSLAWPSKAEVLSEARPTSTTSLAPAWCFDWLWKIVFYPSSTYSFLFYRTLLFKNFIIILLKLKVLYFTIKCLPDLLVLKLSSWT